MLKLLINNSFSYNLTRTKSRGMGMTLFKECLVDLWNGESGVSRVEFVLLLAFIAIGISYAAGELLPFLARQGADSASACAETGFSC